MRKIFNKFLRFWYFKVKNVVKREVEIGGFRFQFRNYDLVITSLSDNFSLRVRATEFMFGYLASALAQGKDDQLHGYAAVMYILAGNMAKDAKLSKEVIKAVDKFAERQDALAEAEAKKVTDSENDSALEMEKDNVAVAKMSRQQRRKHKREMEKVLKEALGNKNEVKNE